MNKQAYLILIIQPMHRSLTCGYVPAPILFEVGFCYVQKVKPVPAIFFLEVHRYRSTPFWHHPALVPLKGTDAIGSDSNGDIQWDGTITDPFADVRIEDDEFEEESRHYVGKSTGDELEHLASLCEEFASALRFQIQFNDHRFLSNTNRHGNTFFNFISNCLEYERQMNSTRTANPNTWGVHSASTMFYRTRPFHLIQQHRRMKLG